MHYLTTFFILFFYFFLLPLPDSYCRQLPIERSILEVLSNEDLNKSALINECNNEKYAVYLIDNFDEKVHLVPELEISHGELMLAILQSGRDDIDVKTINSSLSRGLATVLSKRLNGECIDAVISSIPGSNYSYRQVASLLSPKHHLTSDNIVEYRDTLLALMKEITIHGFPSVKWLKQIEVNPVKLREDARKVVFIEELGTLNIPVYLPYGNADVMYKGELKKVNLLSLAYNGHVYSGVDREGNRLVEFPYSPLSSGDSQAMYRIVECPSSDNARLSYIDINEDGYMDFSYPREDIVPYYDEKNQIAFAPPPIKVEALSRVLAEKRPPDKSFFDNELVITVQEYKKLLEKCENCLDMPAPVKSKSFVWLNSDRHGLYFFFNPECQHRGSILGTSLIPPTKVKEYLPPMQASYP